jgi:hypothetical protein
MDNPQTGDCKTDPLTALQRQKSTGFGFAIGYQKGGEK